MPKSNGRPPDRVPAPKPYYDLTPLERAEFQHLMNGINAAKAAMFDAQEQLQTARNNLALRMRSLADQHGMQDVQMPPDFSRISPK